MIKSNKFKSLLFSIAISFFSLNVFSQTTKSLIGEFKFSYRDSSYLSLMLNENGKFKYTYADKKQNVIPLGYSIFGDWQLKGNSLILDSHPLSTNTNVLESQDIARKGITIYVHLNKKRYQHYELYAIKKNDTIKFSNQKGKTKLDSDVNAFFISKGHILTNTYNVYLPMNVFHVYFNSIRVFDKEVWEVTSKSVIPKSPDGKPLNYTLIKR